MRDRSLDWIAEKYVEVLKKHKTTRSTTVKEQCEDEMSILLWIRKIVEGQPYDA